MLSVSENSGATGGLYCLYGIAELPALNSNSLDVSTTKSDTGPSIRRL